MILKFKIVVLFFKKKHFLKSKICYPSDESSGRVHSNLVVIPKGSWDFLLHDFKGNHNSA